ncbi:MAG: oligosaccharide flippase family protein [Flavobacteriales bacterium]|nr:oligosaccharide flippase family protein [Flavobacteriales bacterium]
MNPLKKLASQTAIYGLSSVIGRLLNYLLVPLYTRYFLPAEYGVVTELYAYVAFLVIMLTYGFETAFFNFTKKEDNKEKVYSTAMFSLLISSVIFIILSIIYSSSISEWMGYGIESRYVQYFAVIIGLDAISSISFAKLREEEKAVRFAVIRLLNIFSNIGLNLYFIVYKGFGIEYIFIANLISSVITILLLMPEMFISKFNFDTKLWKKMAIYAFPLLIAGLAGMTNETIDRILLKKLLPNPEIAASELGLYGAFYKLSIIMTLFIQTFRYAAEPFFFSQHKSNDNKKVYADVMKYFTIIMIVIFLGVTMFYDFVIGFLGEAYHDERGFLVVSILLLANLFLGIFYNLSIWYKLTEKTKYGAYLSIFGAIITLILNFVLIPIIGFVGSAIATLVCYFSMSVASYFIGKRHFPIPYNLKTIGLYIFNMLGIYFFIYFSPENILFNALLLVGFIIFVYLTEKPKTSKIL